MHGLQTVFPYDLNARVGDEFKIDNMPVSVATKFSFLPRKNSPANREKNHKGILLLLPQQVLDILSHVEH